MSNKENIKIYDISFHLLSSLSEKEIQEEYNSILDLIKSEGEIIKEDKPNLIDLAYTINHRERNSEGKYTRFFNAYFSSIKFASSQVFVTKIDASVKSNKNILRHLLIETTREETRTDLSVIEAEKKEKKIQKMERNTVKA